jgi:hypothetical protein
MNFPEPKPLPKLAKYAIIVFVVLIVSLGAIIVVQGVMQQKEKSAAETSAAVTKTATFMADGVGVISDIKYGDTVKGSFSKRGTRNLLNRISKDVSTYVTITIMPVEGKYLFSPEQTEQFYTNLSKLGFYVDKGTCTYSNVLTVCGTKSFRVSTDPSQIVVTTTTSTVKGTAN